LRDWLLAAVLGSGVAAMACWRGALTLDGAVAAAWVGGITFRRGGVPATAALLIFFSTSSVLSRLGIRRKQRGSLAPAKGAQRDAWQVLANGGFATLSILLGRPRGGGGFLGALSAACADTWATELGMLAGRQPRLITTLHPVEPGTSGGITPEGLGASLAGALSVGLAWSLAGGGRQGIPLALAAGLSGSLVDSWLGATVQALYRCMRCDALTEEPVHRQCGRPAWLVRGQPWITNDTVNGLSTLAGALVGASFRQAPTVRGRLAARANRSTRRRGQTCCARRVG
jgi:uncharacterized protein (TIGR00297 family)